MTVKQCHVSVQQRQLLQPDLMEVRGKLEGIARLLKTWCGDEAQPFTRAVETLAAVQRLEWALERDEPEFSRSAGA